jgi:hypothetical protein
MPTVQGLNNVIDQAKYHAFETVVTSQRQAIENAALALVTLLDTAELRTEFNGLPDVQRWDYTVSCDASITPIVTGDVDRAP